ncbi:MAG: hypothetical protein HN590_17165, partial [Calditrichaeota bacterium]|nr:hypothetical protein [Calditrichota bacterium]
MLKNTISLVILTFCLTCFTNLLSEPHRVFGDEGTFLYSNPMHELLGIHSILGGEEVMVFWSENRLEDGFRGVYLQVVNETGEFRYENPIRLTLENMTSDDGMVTKDGEGNLYVAWSATIPEDGAEKILFVQKYDGDGDPLWGDEPRGIISFESELNKRTLIGLIPDDHGGVYALSNWGFIALDENCQLRRDWEWNERRPDPEHDRLHSAISDDHGGFWYIASVDRSIMNRITYEGEKLWEEMRPIANDEFPEGAVVNNPLCGLNGGLLLRYRQTEGNHRRVGIFRMDENGEFVGEEFSHVIQEIDGHIDIDVEKLREGRIAILYKKRPTDEDPEVWLTIYDPDENEFVNSNQGVQVVSWNSWGIRLVGVTEHTNGDLTLKIGLSDSGRYLGECFLYSNNLERRRRDSVLIPNLGNAKFGTYAADNGVWLFGYKTNTLPRQPLLLYRLNQNGNYEDLWPVHPVRSNRNYRPYGGIIWESGNNYHNLYEGTSNWERGICHLALDSTGQFTGDPEGVNLTETNTTRNLKTKMAGNRIIRGWRHQTSYTPVLSCFTDEPELEWNIEFDTPLISHDTGLEIDMAPNGEFTYL